MEPRSLMGDISDMYIGTATVLIPVSKMRERGEGGERQREREGEGENSINYSC